MLLLASLLVWMELQQSLLKVKILAKIKKNVFVALFVAKNTRNISHSLLATHIDHASPQMALEETSHVEDKQKGLAVERTQVEDLKHYSIPSVLFLSPAHLAWVPAAL